MLRTVSYVLCVLFLIHGLVHLMGFVAYWPIAKVDQLPYKTAFLNGRLELGSAGTRAYGAGWLLAALGFAAAAALLAFNKPAWAWVLLAAVALSIPLVILDWRDAFRGFWINVALLLVLFVEFGFRVQPAPFPAYAGAVAQPETVAIPAGLPAPVERMLRAEYGDRIPVYTSAVISGRGTVIFNGISLPSRLRFTHVAGQGYRHYFQSTFWGFPILEINERYLDGVSNFQLPVGDPIVDDPKQNAAANQGLWAESIVYPAVFATDPRLKWEAVDDAHAKLFVPFEGGTQEILVTFDPATAKLLKFETMRYRDVNGDLIHWWGDVTYPADETIQRWAIHWGDQSYAWLVANVEDAVFNADVSEYVRKKGL